MGAHGKDWDWPKLKRPPVVWPSRYRLSKVLFVEWSFESSDEDMDDAVWGKLGSYRLVRPRVERDGRLWSGGMGKSKGDPSRSSTLLFKASSALSCWYSSQQWRSWFSLSWSSRSKASASSSSKTPDQSMCQAASLILGPPTWERDLRDVSEDWN